MKILVATNSCTAEKYADICRQRKRAMLDPQQKFFRLLISGLGNNKGAAVTALCALPVSASSISQKIFRLEKDSEDHARYVYLPFYNGKFLRYATLALSSGKYAAKWCRRNRHSKAAVVVDPIVPVVAIPTRLAAQLYRIKVIAVVTDLPHLTTNMKGRKESLLKRTCLNLYQKLSDWDLQSYDAYVPLTLSINDVVNPKKKPFAVVEGFADSCDTTVSDTHKKYIMYAGGVYEKYGLKNLVEAFLAIDRQDVELYIFGEGTYVEEIQKLQEQHPRLKYMGCVSPEEAVAYEKEALLLVNPRPTEEEFSKYSFPSKTMEYMLSGTAVLSTRLPGIPDEYFDYIFPFGASDTESMRKSLNDILSMPEEELLKKGQKAHDFVMKQKNNRLMSKKIIDLARRI